MRVYRIGDPQGLYPIFSGDGAAKVEGRWHERGQDVIYASAYYSTSLLEKLAHWNGHLPKNQHYIEIEIPVGTSYEVVTKDTLPGWVDASKARLFGSKWFNDRRTAILIVPSYVARIENNVLIHPHHPDFKGISCGLETPVPWDARLFSRSP
jgi:RES domain-containing protein